MLSQKFEPRYERPYIVTEAIKAILKKFDLVNFTINNVKTVGKIITPMEYAKFSSPFSA